MGPTPTNWRTLATPAVTTVTDPALLTALESPVTFTMSQGTITTLTVSSLEPEWTVNLKKAMLGLLKIQVLKMTMILMMIMIMMMMTIMIMIMQMPVTSTEIDLGGHKVKDEVNFHS